MIIAGIDTETTGINDNKGEDIEIVELGYAIYDTTRDFLIAQGSELFATEFWGEEGEKIHGIPEYATKLANYKPKDVDIGSRILAYKPQIIVAHNAAYDKKLVIKHWPILNELMWVCTREDLPHEDLISPRSTSTRLMHLAVDYNVYTPGWHRAMIDAITSCRIAAKHDLESIVQTLSLPHFIVVTRGKYNKAGVDAVKKLKFRWNGEAEEWSRGKLLENDAKAIKETLIKIAPLWNISIKPMPSEN